MGKLIFSVPAKDDISGIVAYILPFNEQAADDLHRDIFHTAKKIAQFPHIGRKRLEFGEGLFSFTCRSYLIIYQIEEDTVVISRILDARRDISAIFEETDD